MREAMTVVVQEPLASQIRDAVEAGEYETTSDAIGDAVQLWSRLRQRRETDDLRLAWDAGKAGGLHGNLDFDDLRRESRARLKSLKDDVERAG